MDLSEEYIEMCNKATEIQDTYRQNFDFNLEQSYFYDNETKEIVLIGVKMIGKFKYYLANRDNFVGQEIDSLDNSNYFWLPRQDQLQEVLFKDVKNCNIFLGRVLNLQVYLETFYDNTEESDTTIDSFEKLLLSLLMKQDYNKIWKDNNWIIDAN